MFVRSPASAIVHEVHIGDTVGITNTTSHSFYFFYFIYGA